LSYVTLEDMDVVKLNCEPVQACVHES
jgi:hypothetical protein